MEKLPSPFERLGIGAKCCCYPTVGILYEEDKCAEGFLVAQVHEKQTAKETSGRRVLWGTGPYNVPEITKDCGGDNDRKVVEPTVREDFVDGQLQTSHLLGD